MRLVTGLLLLVLVLVEGEGEESITRRMYDSMAQLVGEPGYPATWWAEREQCLDSLAPNMRERLDLAWLAMITYWEVGGAEQDGWKSCEEQQRWFESNCTYQPGIGCISVES